MQLDPKSVALVLIDLQNGVLAMPVVPHAAAQVYQRSLQLALRFRAVNAPVVWVRVSFSADRADAPHAVVDQPTNYSAIPAGGMSFPSSLPRRTFLLPRGSGARSMARIWTYNCAGEDDAALCWAALRRTSVLSPPHALRPNTATIW